MEPSNLQMKILPQVPNWESIDLLTQKTQS